MVAYVLSPAYEAHVLVFREYSSYRMRPKQAGYFESSYPEYITAEQGVPTIAEILVFLRVDTGHEGAGYLVATTHSAVDGTWRIDGLNPDYHYDVVCRKQGYNDIIFANISPLVD